MTVQERFSLHGKVAIVTGASRGIGAAIARALAEAGAHVVVSSRKQSGCEEMAASLRADGHKATPCPCHMGEAADIHRLVDETIRSLGGIDIIVHNAATNPYFGPVLGADEGLFDKIMAVNVKGPWLLSQAAQPSMAARGGSFIFVSSVGGITPEPLLGLYSVSKAALISLAKVLAKEWGPDIRSNVICPGIVKTRFAEALWSNEAIVKEVISPQPIPRVAEPDEIAPLALFLASGASSYCTGGVYTVDGGHLL